MTKNCDACDGYGFRDTTTGMPVDVSDQYERSGFCWPSCECGACKGEGIVHDDGSPITVDEAYDLWLSTEPSLERSKSAPPLGGS